MLCVHWQLCSDHIKWHSQKKFPGGAYEEMANEGSENYILGVAGVS